MHISVALTFPSVQTSVLISNNLPSSWKVVGLRFRDCLEVGVGSMDVSAVLVPKSSHLSSDCLLSTGS